MFIASYYLFWVIYTYLFTLIFNLDFTNLANPWLYVLLVVSILLSAIISFATQIIITQIFGIFRQNKGIKDQFNHKFANSLLRFGTHLMRAKVIVTGKENIPEPDHNFILMSNHQENWDILILKPIFKDHIVNFIAKAALTNLPIFGRWIEVLGNVFISRYADRSAAESIIKGIRNYKSGTSMGIFPEGKRAFGNEMIDFKSGAMKLAMKPQADILIATQYDTCKAFKSIPWKRYHIRVHIHPILKFEDYEGLNSHEVSAKVKATIQKQLDIFKKELN
ncbi:1-acyl-sn-glycerol-3-phosphate acyltransferase [Candidatus Izimaplasma bacterium HR1]|jgi:1-acyl-sn-glycerol-3-phosphate acyltransferase|uniref:lysophospholipid acyltransferase family protein n=1 Tax=Candidatus Izimoplasma sp. HR1 TaxID=1541959 RepID=UPI0004F5C26C|nr:1-acyl-sn-glycerol-3-phosphate acyltransferase [Candidatus Izimaplasma bacterium HR1]